ncbi:Fe-S cluster assembly protein SufD [Arcanobacterium hippocoleae]
MKLESEAVVKIHGTADTEISPCHLVIDAKDFSEGTVVIEHSGSARFAEGIEVIVGDGAHLTLVTVQDWDDKSAHTLSNRIRVGKDAAFKHIVVSLGGDIVRVTTNVDFTAPGADVNLLGAYFVDAKQHLEHRLLVEHNHPHCRSNVTYKGALQGADAHSVWVGDVLIKPEAEGTDSYELNRNLVLTEGAKADSVPNLEIETGEIEGAGHASATGRFDDEQLFYLKSRGIPEQEARRLVVRGFFAELITQIGVPSVQEKLMAAIENELSMTMGNISES